MLQSFSDGAASARRWVRGFFRGALTRTPSSPLLSELSPALESHIRRLPKVELHLHLEGSIRPETLRQLARSQDRLQEQTEDWILRQAERKFRYESFADFLQAFKLVAMLLETPEAYALATRDLIGELAVQQIRYAEITLSAGVILWKKQSVSRIFEAILAAAREAQTASGITVRWIFDAIRHFGADHAREVLRWASVFRGDGVVAFGIGGDEVKGPAGLFCDVYAEAKDLGLHRTAHAGETAGAESVRQAIELLGAERIGHGLRAAEDEDVMALLRERGIPLEVCPTSNVATGLLASVHDHPLRKFLEADLLVTISSDDPAMFGCTLEQELMLCAAEFSLSEAEITGLCRNAVCASFMNENEKKTLMAELDATAAGGVKDSA